MRNSSFKYVSYHIRRFKEYTQRYIHAGLHGAERRHKILWELFDISNRFLRDTGVNYWVNFGTLLGFYRDKDLISHDIDIDFGCGVHCYKDILNNRHKLNSKAVLQDTSWRHHGPKLYISYKGFDADIYFYEQKEGQLHPLEKTEWPNYQDPIPSDYVYPTCKFTIKHISTRVPADMENYLRHIYGNLSGDARRNPETGYWE